MSWGTISLAPEMPTISQTQVEDILHEICGVPLEEAIWLCSNLPNITMIEEARRAYRFGVGVPVADIVLTILRQKIIALIEWRISR